MFVSSLSWGKRLFKYKTSHSTSTASSTATAAVNLQAHFQVQSIFD